MKVMSKYGKLHNPKKSEVEFPTFQQDRNCDWKNIVSLESKLSNRPTLISIIKRRAGIQEF